MNALHTLIFGRKYFTFEAEYQAVLDRASFLGYTLPDLTQNIINNNIIKNFKNEGLWSKFDVFYYTKQTGSLANFCKLNWINPNLYELTQSNPSLVPDFVSGIGYKAGSGKFWRTNFIPSTDSVNTSQTNACIMFKMFDIPSTYVSQSRFFGTRNGNDAGQISFQNVVNASMTIRLYTTTFEATGSALTQLEMNENFIVNKNGILSNNLKFYKNGIFTSQTRSSATNALPIYDLCLLGINSGGTVSASTNACGISYFGLLSASHSLGKELIINQIINNTY